MSDDTTEDLIVTAEAELPDFEGITPVAVITKLNGAGQRIHRPLHLEEKVVLVVEAHVANVGHGATADGVKRIHTLRVDDLYEMEGKVGSRLLRRLKDAFRRADDRRHGREALPIEGLDAPEGAEFTTDSSGVVMTDGDLASLGLADASNDPAAIVFDSEARAMWPDDFPTGTPCPDAGDRIVPPGGTDVDLVRQVLDAHTGEALDTWTDEAEEARLLEEEQEAERDEARQDREAVETMERTRMVQQPPCDGYDDMTGAAITSWVTSAEMTDEDVARHVVAYEGAHKGRSGVLKTAQARAEWLRRQAERDRVGHASVEDTMAVYGDSALPPLPGEDDEAE